MPTFVGAPVGAWGYIPRFLDERDPRRAREQISDHYPGGWMDAPSGLTFDREQMTLKFPGDPPFESLGTMLFRDEVLLLFTSDFVLILQRDGSWECARLD